MRRFIFAVVALAMLPWSSLFADIVLNINLSTQEFDWVNGTSINHLPDSADDNRFTAGADVLGDVVISSPLPAYVGVGTHTAVEIDISGDGSAIDGVAFDTSDPPDHPASFAGTADAPTVATFDTGDFAALANLAPGSYDLPALASNWDGVVRVNVMVESPSFGTTARVPSNSVWGLVVMSLLILLVGLRARRRIAP